MLWEAAACFATIDDQLISEICLIISDRRVASVVAVCYCHTYSLHADDLNEILDDYPMMRETLEKVAAERLKNIGGLIVYIVMSAKHCWVDCLRCDVNKWNFMQMALPTLHLR